MHKALFCLVVLAIGVFLPTVSKADASWAFDPNAPLGFGGAVGMELNKVSTDPWPTCLVWTLDGQYCWGAGMDVTRNYPGTPDLVLAYSRDTNADNLRLRSDTAQMVLGPQIGHPPDNFAQFLVAAGTQSQPLGGIAVGTYGYEFGLYLFNRNAWEKRNTISLQNLFCLQTDTQENGTGDFQFYNFQARAPVYTVTPANGFCLVAGQEGFYGAAPVAKQVVTGSWSDGSAAKSLLASLVKIGLVTDQTTN